MQKEGRQWRRTVCNLVDAAEVCANVTFRSARTWKRLLGLKVTGL